MAASFCATLAQIVRGWLDSMGLTPFVELYNRHKPTTARKGKGGCCGKGTSVNRREVNRAPLHPKGAGGDGETD